MENKYSAPALELVDLCVDIITASDDVPDVPDVPGAGDELPKQEW